MLKRKELCAAVAVLAIASTAFGQGSAKKIGDAYAKAALLAMKAIQGDGSRPELRDGREYVNRRTMDKIDAADVEATNDDEKTVTKFLGALYEQKLGNNLSREIIRMTVAGKLLTARAPHDDLSVSIEMEKDPMILEINRREAACFDALDNSLRSRSAVPPAACSTIEVQLPK